MESKEKPPPIGQMGETVKPDDEPSSSSTVARPRRATKKNVRYSNADYVTTVATSSEATASEEGAEPVVAPKKGAEPPTGSSRKRKTARRLDEPTPQPMDDLITDGSQMDVAMEYEIPHEEDVNVNVDDVSDADGDDDDGPPVLGTVDEFGEIDDVTGGGGAAMDSDDEVAPDLERNPLTKKRGRPRLTTEGRTSTTSTTTTPRVKPSPRVAPLGGSIVPRMKAGRQNVMLFLPELEVTPEGDTYATVVPGCLTELLRKEKIIELLTNEMEIAQIRSAGWMLAKPPRLPPLTSEKACFAFYIDGANCKNAKELSNDDLRPWTALMDASVPNSVNIKPNVRRHAVALLDGELKIVRSETRLAQYHLTEYNARLPREQRLKKKIFYLSRDNQIYGNVLILYEYMRDGTAPVPINLPHGNDYMRRAAMQDVQHQQHHGQEGDSPFEDRPYEGDRGGLYMKLRAGRIAWAHNKKSLLDYMYNYPDLAQHLAINNRLPDLPPLIETAGVFAYFAHSENIANQIHHAPDGLSPWTVNPPGDVDSSTSSPAPRVRSTRRPLTVEPDETFSIAKDQKTTTPYMLVETMSTLARCKRIRKRVFYIQHTNSHIVGNVCYLYEFVCDGPLPLILSAQEQRQMNQMGARGLLRATPTKLHNNRYHHGAHQDEMMMEHDDEAQGLVPMDDGELVVVDQNYLHQQQQQDPRFGGGASSGEGPSEEEQLAMYPDTLNNGYDMEFGDEQLEKTEHHQQNSDPYFDLPRQLSTGHVYLTVRHKKVVTGLDHVLEWIANSNYVDSRGLLNLTKPLHPPMVTNARAYAFFVAGTAIFPHDINRDDFSPWSGNGNSQNLTRYRSKVRKIGCVVEPNTSTFVLKDHTDYKMCQFHLVYLYSTNPRDPRMRKKIYYIMETESKMVVSHALIVYDYTAEGRIPRLSAGQYKATPKRAARHHAFREAAAQPDPADDEFQTEEHRASPFGNQPMEAIDGTTYLTVTDRDFWTDRNRQIQFLVNEPGLIEEMGCLNDKVPDMPPRCTTKGLYVFFVNMNEINIRSLTIDKLVPWSENVATHHASHHSTIRPKSAKAPLMLNSHGQLRVSKGVEHSEYQIHTYTATLPRCTRLRKKVAYVLRNGGPFGNALIMYSFTEPGDDPQPLSKSMSSSSSFANDDWYHMLTPMVRDDVDVYMRTMNLSDVKKSLYEVHGLNLTRAQLYALQSASQVHQMRQSAAHDDNDDDEDVEIDVDVGYGAWSPERGGASATTTTTTRSTKMEEEEEVVEDQMIGHDDDHHHHGMIVEEEMIVGHTETVPYHHDGHHHHHPHARRGGAPGGGVHHPFLDKSVTNTGYVRGSQRNEALWRIAQKQFGVDSIDQTFDGIFKLLYQRDEQRLLHNIKMVFNVDIVSGDDEQIIVEDVDGEEEDPRYMVDHHHGEMIVVDEGGADGITVDGGAGAGAGGDGQEYMEQVEEDVMT